MPETKKTNDTPTALFDPSRAHQDARFRFGSIDEIGYDPHNANDGTERGNHMLTRSITSNGLGRGIVVDRNLTAIGGNKTAAKAGELELDNVIFVHTTGEELVVTVREDLDLSADPSEDAHRKAVDLAIADNRVSELSLNWNVGELINLNNAGSFDLDEHWMPDEFEGLVNGMQDEGSGDSDNDNDDKLGGNDDKERECCCPKCGHTFIQKI